VTRLQPIAAEVLTVAQAHSTRHFGGWALIAIAVAIWILWPIVAIKHWQNVIESHTRLGYFIADMTIVAPLCFASGYGSIQDYSWAGPLLLVAVGAAAYDLTHFLIFLAQIQVPKINGKPLPVAVYPVTILAVLAFLGWLAWREIRIEISHPGGTLAAFTPGGTGLYVGLGAVAIGALATGAVLLLHARRAAAALRSSPPGE
jgi:hypothetical protein